jgi:acetyl esterase/lipase
MQIIALAAGLLFTFSLSMTVSDTIWAVRSAQAITSATTPLSGSKQTLAYGSNKLQRLDYWSAPKSHARDAPLVVFVHGGGWKRGDKQMMDGSAKLKHWQALGCAVASVNYRLVPENTVEEQAADVAAALAHLKKHAGKLSFDPTRIALVGHSAGAHLVALIGTDPQYLRTAGLSFGDIRGIVPLDGAAYDVAEQIDDGPRIMHDTYVQAFGTDPARQKRLSPTMQAAAPNAPEFLILHVQRKDGTRQSRELGDALKKAGTSATVQGFSGRGLRGHAEINRKLGEPDYPATPVVDAFLKRVFD